MDTFPFVVVLVVGGNTCCWESMNAFFFFSICLFFSLTKSVRWKPHSSFYTIVCQYPKNNPCVFFCFLIYFRNDFRNDGKGI